MRRRCDCPACNKESTYRSPRCLGDGWVPDLVGMTRGARKRRARRLALATHRPDAVQQGARERYAVARVRCGVPLAGDRRHPQIVYVNPAHSGECNAPGPCAGCDALECPQRPPCCGQAGKLRGGLLARVIDCPCTCHECEE